MVPSRQCRWNKINRKLPWRQSSPGLPNGRSRVRRTIKNRCRMVPVKYEALVPRPEKKLATLPEILSGQPPIQACLKQVSARLHPTTIFVFDSPLHWPPITKPTSPGYRPSAIPMPSSLGARGSNLCSVFLLLMSSLRVPILVTSKCLKAQQYEPHWHGVALDPRPQAYNWQIILPGFHRNLQWGRKPRLSHCRPSSLHQL